MVRPASKHAGDSVENMTEITDRADVERILADPAALVPEAGSDGSPMGCFRARVSRFVNGPVHEARRALLEAMLDELPPAELALIAAARTAAVLEAAGATAAAVASTDEMAHRVAVDSCARQVPVATLAGALGFTDPDALPPLVATVAAVYPTGEANRAADAAVTELLESSGDHDDVVRAMLVQLLVQAYAATAGLIARALELAAGDARAQSTRPLLEAVLRDDSPVPFTRRVVGRVRDGGARHGEELVTLRLDGPDRGAGQGRPARLLAFGAGARACPASHHALAIAEAIVDAARDDDERRRSIGDAAAPTHSEETAFDAHAE